MAAAGGTTPAVHPQNPGQYVDGLRDAFKAGGALAVIVFLANNIPSDRYDQLFELDQHGAGRMLAAIAALTIAIALLMLYTTPFSQGPSEAAPEAAQLPGKNYLLMLVLAAFALLVVALIMLTYELLHISSGVFALVIYTTVCHAAHETHSQALYGRALTRDQVAVLWMVAAGIVGALLSASAPAQTGLSAREQLSCAALGWFARWLLASLLAGPGSRLGN